MTKACVLSLLSFHEIVYLLQSLFEEVVVAELIVDLFQLGDGFPHVLVLQVVFRVLRQDFNLKVIHLTLFRDDFFLRTYANLTVFFDQFRIRFVFRSGTPRVGLG